MAKLTKRMQKASEAIDRKRQYPVEEAVGILKANATAKFDETLEISINLGIDPRHADQQVRGMVSLPSGTGKTVRVAVFARGEKADIAKQAGADIVGAEDLMEKIQGGMMDFDRCIATPDMMAIVGRLGKILGPRNLMPNPKLGTVTPNIKEAIEATKGGEVQFRAEKNGIIHAGVGKVSFSQEALVANVQAFLTAIRNARPSGAKGTYVRRVSLASTMGPSLQVDTSQSARA